MWNHLGINPSLVNEKSRCWWRWAVRVQQLQVLGLLIWVTLGADTENVVRTLPGFDGELPFKLETGYVGVGKKEEIQLFFYFIESQRDPVKDPLLLWLTGGPGSSGLSGILYEVGPFQFNYTAYNGGLPSLIPNPYSFTQVASVIFLDAPVETGFSYSMTNDSFPITDTSSAGNNYQFLQKWLLDHPNFSKNPLYIAGDSYSGIIVPLLVQEIHKGRQSGHEPEINLHGYILGNPLTIAEEDLNMMVPYAHRLSLLSDELYESARLSCNGNYFQPDVNDSPCFEDIKAIIKCLSAVYSSHVLEPACPFPVLDNTSDIIVKDALQGRRPWCRDFNYLLSSRWARNPRVQEALHIRVGTVSKWVRLNDELPYVYDTPSVLEHHRSFLKTSYRALIYSGDHDYTVSVMATMRWIMSLNLTVDDSWKPWFVNSRAAGFTETYMHGDFKMTYATVLGAGHTAPEYKPEPCLKMLDRWLAHADMHGTSSVEAASDHRFTSQ